MYKEKFLFISHAEKDSSMIEKFIDLLYHIGIPEKSMFCSSISELGVPIKEDIYEYLRNLLDSEQVIPIFMLSDNYYSSAACLNEMGAVWIKQTDYFTFLLPNFEFSKIKGAINPSKKGIPLYFKSERELQNLKNDLNQFREEMTNLFGVEKNEHWERKRDEFITQIKKIKIDSEVMDIDLEACEGYCIGEFEHEGCKVIFDKNKSKISSKINFKKTKAKICSIVIHVGEINLSNLIENKNLIFDLRTSNTIQRMEVECRLKNGDVRSSIMTTADWEHYIIPLSEFGGITSEWAELKEIKFLIRRKDTTGGIVEVKNLMIR